MDKIQNLKIDRSFFDDQMVVSFEYGERDLIEYIDRDRHDEKWILFDEPDSESALWQHFQEERDEIGEEWEALLEQVRDHLRQFLKNCE